MIEVKPEQYSQLFLPGANINKMAQEAAIVNSDAHKETGDDLNTKDNLGASSDTAEVQQPDESDSVADVGGEAKEGVFSLEFFNKQFATDLKSEDEIKGLIESAKRIVDLQKQVDSLPFLQEELDMLRQENDPMHWFSSEEDFKVAQFKKQFPDKDPSMVARLFTSDLSNASDFDVLVWATMLDNPGLEDGEVGARALVADSYGIDDPSSLADLDSLTRNKLRVIATKERARVREMKDGIKSPEKRDYSQVLAQRKQEQEAKMSQLKNSWDVMSKEVASSFPDIVINDSDKDGNVKEVFRYVVGKDLDVNMVGQIVDNYVKAGVPVNEETVKQLGLSIQKEFVYRNADKIVKQAVKNATASLEEKMLQEQHNPGAPGEQERPKTGGSDLMQRILNDLRGDRNRPKRAF